MMRIFILAIGTRGDVEMFLNLGEELLRRGHQIVVGTSAFFAERVQLRKLAWVQVGSGTAPQMVQILTAMSAMSLLDRTDYFIQNWVKPQLDAGLPTIIGYAQSADYFVNNLKMRLRRRGSLIPCASVTYELSEDSPPMESPATAEEYRRIVNLVAMNRELVDPNRAWGDEYCFTGFWTRRPQEQFTPSSQIAQFLNEGPPPLVVTFGSMMPVIKPELLAMIASSISDAGARAILLGGHAIPGSFDKRLIFIAEEIPYAWLFQKAACVFHHGGMGTAASAVQAGVPSIILPWIAAQERVAQAMSVAGLASLVPRSTIGTGTMTRILIDVLTDQTRRTVARRWADRVVHENGSECAASAIENHFQRVRDR